MDNFSRCLAFTLNAEGGYTDNAADPGNWTGGEVGRGALHGTKFGISAAAYPNLDIAALTLPDAAAIYRRDYWTPVQGDALLLPLAMVAFDAAVNAGPRRAAMWLQQAAGQIADGILGPASLAALNTGNPQALAQEALVRRLMFYTNLPGWPHFGLGWLRRVVKLAGEIML
ncbi:MAG: glycosyl hydrolase 108 family protein [Acidocella sp.]|nr:glycosyl hydrolase 108 family protein [Acidocella sp.]